MRVIKECDRIDYMNGIPLHDYSSETIMVEGEHSLYMAFISRMSMDTLSLRPIQQTDAERYGSDSRVLYLQRNSMGGSHIVSSGTTGSMHDGMGRLGSYTHIDEVGAYPSCPPEPQQVSQSYTWGSSARWVSPHAEEQPVENTPELEREYGILRPIYNRIRI